MSVAAKTVADVLREAKALISDPEKWIKGADGLADPADDVTTDALDASDDDAVCFCAGGAILRASGEGEGAPLRAFESRCMTAFASVQRKRFPHEFNDLASTTHADVMRTFDIAIAEAEKA